MDPLFQTEEKTYNEDGYTSNEERDIKEELEEKSVSKLIFTGDAPSAVDTLLFTSDSHSKALTKIVFELAEIGEVETVHKEKTLKTLKIFYAAAQKMLVC